MQLGRQFVEGASFRHHGQVQALSGILPLTAENPDLVRKGARNSRWTDKGIEQVEGDLNDTESLSPAFQGVGKFFSVSPMVEWCVSL